MAEKNTHIETLRGIAILLVVMGHVIGIDRKGGMQVADDSLFRYFYDLLANIRMPLFTVISGWVYALHPVGRGETKIFLRKKARRLLLPLLFVGTTYFLVQYLIPGTNNKAPLADIWRIYLFPYTIYWYLPALFLLFVGMAFVDARRQADTLGKWSLWLLLGCGLCLAELTHFLPASVPNYFAFKNAFYLAPFFVAGIGLNRFRSRLCTPPAQRIYLGGLLGGVVLQQLHYFFPDAFTLYQTTHVAIFIGLLSSAYFINLKLHNTFLIWLARYTYTIYLFHGFGTAGGRILLGRLGIHEPFVIFAGATLVATFLPVVVEKILIRWKFTRICFLGKNSAEPGRRSSLLKNRTFRHPSVPTP